MQTISKKIGAKRGAKEKSGKYRELKAVVLGEFLAHHQDKKAAAAARDIVRKLEKTDWLTDEQGKPLSKDPTLLITRWIREFRKNNA